MACYRPLRAYRNVGGRVVVCSQREVLNGEPFWVPCGRCKACLSERARQWSVRGMHEAKCHDENSFVTLTVRDECLGDDQSLDRRAFPLFMKRLRKEVAGDRGSEVRYLMCGEYGTRYKRPHYHACLFGVDFSGDREEEVGGVGTEYPVFRSPTLERLWPFGRSQIGSVTPESVAYVARYGLKGAGHRVSDHYLSVDEDGVYQVRVPEFSTMSTRPALGLRWLEKFGREVYENERSRGVVVWGRLQKPPRFYDKWLQRTDPVLYEEVMWQREVEARKRDPVPLEVIEAITEAKVHLFSRELE